MKAKLTRRGFLAGAAATVAAAAIVPTRTPAEEPAKTADYRAYLVYADPEEQVEDATGKDIEGPFYRAGAPLRTTLLDKREKDEMLVASGKVVERSAQPAAGAEPAVMQ